MPCEEDIARAWLSRVILGGEDILYEDWHAAYFPRSHAVFVDGVEFSPLVSIEFICYHCNNSLLTRPHANVAYWNGSPRLFCSGCHSAHAQLHDGDERYVYRRPVRRQSGLLSYGTDVTQARKKTFLLADGEKPPAKPKESLRRSGVIKVQTNGASKYIRTTWMKTHDPVWIGVELEVDAINDRDEAIAWVEEVIGDFVICKADYSLDEDAGFEIVSVPGTHAWHREAWLPFLKEAPSYVVGWSTGYGLHVHVSRESLGGLAGGRLMAFIHNPQNHAFLHRLAGRDSSYAEYNANTGVADIMNGNRMHYDAAGPSASHPTIEIRIFRSNVSKHGFLRVIDFVAALCRWCQNGAGSDLTYDTFLRWFMHPSVRVTYPDFDLWVRRQYERFAPRDGRKVNELVGTA